MKQVAAKDNTDIYRCVIKIVFIAIVWALILLQGPVDPAAIKALTLIGLAYGLFIIPYTVCFYAAMTVHRKRWPD